MRGFSLYDMEQFFRDAGAPRVNEKAMVSLEKELNDTVKQLVEEAQVYANYAGRRKTIKRADVAFVGSRARKPGRRYMPATGKRKAPAKLLQRNRLMHAVAKYH
jgi:histone H3/H4